MPKSKRFVAGKDAAHATVEKFWEFKNLTAETADLYFYGDIVSDWWGAWQEEDQYPEAIKNFLEEAEGRDLNIYINSGGGSVFAGIAIYNMLKRYPGRKTCYVDALAGSIASILPFVADEKPIIPANAFLMVHKPWMACDGNAAYLRKMADDLDRIEVGIWKIYEEHLAEGVTIEQVKELMEAETWLDGTTAAQYFNVSIGEENTMAAAVQEYTKEFCKNIPACMVLQEKESDRDPEKDLNFRREIAALAAARMGV